jgi:hypothetical protein
MSGGKVEVTHPIRDPAVQSEVERKAALVEAATAGKVTVEFNLKDGKWSLGNVSVTFPRRHTAAGI